MWYCCPISAPLFESMRDALLTRLPAFEVAPIGDGPDCKIAEQSDQPAIEAGLGDRVGAVEEGHGRRFRRLGRIVLVSVAQRADQTEATP